MPSVAIPSTRYFWNLISMDVAAEPGGIVQRHGGENPAVMHMGGRVRRAPIILIPDALSVVVDGGTAFTISTDGDGAVFCAATLQPQKYQCADRPPQPPTQS